MDIEDIYELLLEHFGWEPTESQESVLEELAGFLADDNDQSLFLLKGFAGTGKTTLVNTLGYVFLFTEGQQSLRYALYSG